MQRQYPFIYLCFAFCLLWASSRTFAFEEANYASLDDVGAGSLLLWDEQGYQPFIRSNAVFDVEVNGLVSRVKLRQVFENPGQEWVEAVYVLPLPQDSAVNAMRIKIGERVIEGEIKEKQEAKRIYTQAKAEGKRAGLLQQQRPNLFSTQVANIGPGETVEVELTFLQVLHYDSGQFSLRLPMTLTPRYIPGVSLMEVSSQNVKGWAFPTAQVPDAHLITPPQTHKAGEDQLQARISIVLNTGFDVEQFKAPYHTIDVTRLSAEYKVSTQSNTVPMDRDFVLNWKPVAQQAPVAAYFSEQIEGQPHGLIMLLPPAQSDNLQIGPRELVMIIDSSGSMSGQSMVQAKQAVQMALDRLRPQDRFNLIDFDSGFKKLFADSVFAEPGALRRARFFVDSLVADGGTAMYAPLQAALSGSAAEDAQSDENITQVVFITDGSVGNEMALFELIHKHIGSKRLYTVGIGSAPNAYFMRKAAEFGRGTYTYVGNSDEVQGKMSELFAKIEKPALTHLQVKIDGAEAELYPQPIPDLYLGEPLIIKARFDDQPNQIQIEGRFEGQPWQTHLQLQQGGSADGIATLWARSKVAHLQDEGIQQGNVAQHRDAIIQLGIEHNLVTSYTSFVAVDKTPVRPMEAPVLTDQVANRMPAGSTQKAPSVGYPRTALGLHWHLLIGAMLLGLALLLWQRSEFGGEHYADLA